MKQPLIRFENIFKKFGANQVLRGVNLSIYQGEVATIIGKSVLLKHIIGFLYPDAGEIFLYGRDD